MKAGQWSLKLSPETPKSVRDILGPATLDGTGYNGHVFIFDSVQRPGQSDATMIATSRWGGIVRRRQTPWDVSGVNMIAWLGDEDGKGPILESSLGGGANDFNTFRSALLAQCPAITAGTIAVNAGGTSTASYQWVTPRVALDSFCSILGVEYRVNKDATLDSAPVGSSAIFKQTPTAIMMKNSSGRDLNLTGISVTNLAVSIDSEEYYTRALVKDATGAWTAAAGGIVLFRGLGLDTDGTLGAWTTDAGTPTMTANVVTGTAGTFISAGSTTWADQTVTVRTQWKTTGGPIICARYNGTANYIGLQLSGTQLISFKVIATVQTNGTPIAAAPVNNTFYWLQIVMTGTSLVGNLYNDIAGAQGTLIGTVSQTITDSAVATGKMALRFPVNVESYGGAYANVCTVLGPTTYKDLKGNLITMTKAVTAASTPNLSAAIQARQLALAGAALRMEIAVSTDEFDINRDVAVGDWMYVYDQDSNLVDTTNPVYYRGSTVYPIKLRVLATTWPIERGMSVWYRDRNAVWTDLSDYVLWESPGATFEVGAASRALLTTP